MTEKILYKRFLLAYDNFYDNPDEVYQAALNAQYYQPRFHTGVKSREVYHPEGIKEKLERILGIKINRWDTDPKDENGIFYQGFAKGKKKEIPGVHYDHPYNDITAVIYLTPDLPVDCGTSLWMHKQTNICNPPDVATARKLKMKLNDLRIKFDYESTHRSKWIETDRIGYQFNRMVAYPSGALHSATNHFGSSLSNVRLYQTFRIGVDWDTFKK